MKTGQAAIIAAIFGLTILEIPDAHANGVDLNVQCRSGFAADRAACENFVQGIIFGIAISPHPTVCFPRNYDTRISLPIVERFMRVHPEKLSNGPALVVQAALVEAYPCDYGKVSPSILGVRVQTLSPFLAQSMRINAAGGAVVKQVQPQSSAAKGGIEVDDVITSFNGEPILDNKQLIDKIAEKQPGATVKLGLWRNGKELVLTAALDKR